MRVDSSFEPRLVPQLAVSWAVARAHVHFFNQIDVSWSQLFIPPILEHFVFPL